MSNKTKIKTLIRGIVREEVAMAINEVITELKQPSLSQPVSQPKPKQKIVEKQSFTKNSILNEVMNETAASEEWKTMGGETYTSDKVNEVATSQYGDLMNGSSQQNVNPNDPMSQFVNKDYREVLKRTSQKQKQKYGK